MGTFREDFFNFINTSLLTIVKNQSLVMFWQENSEGNFDNFSYSVSRNKPNSISFAINENH